MKCRKQETPRSIQDFSFDYEPNLNGCKIYRMNKKFAAACLLDVYTFMLSRSEIICGELFQIFVLLWLKAESWRLCKHKSWMAKFLLYSLLWWRVIFFLLLLMFSDYFECYESFLFQVLLKSHWYILRIIVELDNLSLLQQFMGAIVDGVGGYAKLWFIDIIFLPRKFCGNCLWINF